MIWKINRTIVLLTACCHAQKQVAIRVAQQNMFAYSSTVEKGGRGKGMMWFSDCATQLGKQRGA